MNENLTKALRAADDAAAELRYALNRSSCVEWIILSQLVARAAELERDINALIAARADDLEG